MDWKLVKKFVFLGVMSGLLSAIDNYLIPHQDKLPWPLPGILFSLPGVIFGLFLYIAGISAKVIPSSRRIVGMVALVAASVVGWIYGSEMAFNFVLSSPQGRSEFFMILTLSFAYVIGGGFGAFMVSSAVVWVWNITHRRLLFISLVTLLGALGGPVFLFVEEVLELRDPPASFIGIAVWQGLVLGTAAVALCLSKAHERQHLSIPS
jgi:hypothetical protein